MLRRPDGTPAPRPRDGGVPSGWEPRLPRIVVAADVVRECDVAVPLELRDGRARALRLLPLIELELRLDARRGNPFRELPPSLLDLPRLEKLDLRWLAGRFAVADALEARGCLVYR